MPNKLSQFWQELKRRNVVRVITVYAGAAFVIIELINNITEPLKLPEWTPTLVIVLLAIGFPIAIIFSWIYDVKPEGGMVKTEPAHKVKAEDIPKSSNGWRVASIISFVVIVALILVNVIPRSNRDKEFRNLEKSIAVLPFTNMTSEENFAHIGSAFCDEIIMELQKINSFDRVLSHTSTMQYAENRPTIPEIGEKLNVNFLVEGSIQKHGDEVSIKVQVIRAKQEDHIWADEYNGKWVDIFTIQDEIAFMVAKELQVVLSPEEQEQIEKIPTPSLTAHDFYQRGREKYNQYLLDNENTKALERAGDLYYKALEYDSTFALAYTGLAYVYWDKHYWETYFSEDFLDSVLNLANIALAFDPQLSDAFTVRGNYYRANHQIEQSIREYDKAIKLNPNDGMAFYWRGWTYRHSNKDFVKAIEDYHKAVSLYRGPLLPVLLRGLGWTYWQVGFPEKLRFYEHKALMLDGDSISYYYALNGAENYLGNGSGAILEKLYLLDTTRNDILGVLGGQYGYEGEFEKSLFYQKKYYKRLEALGSYRVQAMHRLAYAYSRNGFYAEADYYIDTMIEYYKDLNNVGRGLNSEYNLACIYAFRGEKEKAYEYLEFFDQLEIIPFWWISLFRIDPFFDSIRDEPEFQQILSDVEAKYQAEHERVRQWLEENDRL